MGRNSDLNERILISLVRDGQWEIDTEGRLWCVFIRKGFSAFETARLACVAPSTIQSIWNGTTWKSV
jgi:hypothetical protein